VNRAAQAVILLLLGGAVLRVTVADLHLRYVKPSLGPFLVAAGLLLVAAGGVTLYQEHLRDRDARSSPPDLRDDEPDLDHGHDHNQHRPRVAWLLLLPVIGMLMVSPAALGSYAAERSGTAVSGFADGDRLAALPDSDPAPLPLLDYASRAIHGEGATLGGRRIQLTGFLAIGPDGRPFLARMVLSCCAADGRPVKIGLAGDVPTGRPADTWVTVTGTYIDRTTPDPINGEPIPYLLVEQWQQIPPPKQQYE
jgi:uncharacterized repeat protein (TIGR03943 family)